MQKKSKICLLVFTIGALFLIASSGSEIESVPLTYDFGLMQMLPPLFWLGFSLCLISIVVGIKNDSRTIFYIKSLLLFVFIASIPILFLKNPFWPGSYEHVYESLPITLSGHVPALSFDLPWVFESYPANFPGYFILLSILLQITGLDGVAFSKYYPILSNLITFIAVSVLFKTLLKGASQTSYRYAMLLFMLGNVYLQFQVSPQSLFFVVGILAIIALERSTPKFRFIAIFLFFSIVMSHPTTLFVVLPFVVVWRFLTKFYFKNKHDGIRAPAVLFTLMWIAWMMFFAITRGETIIDSIVTQFLSLFSPQILVQEAGTQLGGVFTVPPIIRLIVLATLGMFSFSCLIMEWREKTKNFPIYAAFLFTPVILTFLDVALGSGLYDRYLLFFVLMSIPLSMKIIHRLRPHLKSFLIALILILAILNFTTLHYQAAQYVYSDETLIATKFADTSTNVQIYGPRYYYGLLPNFDNPYSSSILRLAAFQQIYPTSVDNLTKYARGPCIIVVDYMSRTYYEVHGTTQAYDFYERSVAALAPTKIYDSGRYDFWVLG